MIDDACSAKPAVAQRIMPPYLGMRYGSIDPAHGISWCEVRSHHPRATDQKVDSAGEVRMPWAVSIVEAGLYQLTVVVPSAASGDQGLLATIGGVTTPAKVLITLQ